MDNDVIDALPTSGQPDAPLLRNFLIKRMVYNILSTEDPQTFDALDPDTGAVPEVLGWNGTFFWLDPDDTTSDHDGVTIIKTADDYRYKIEDTDFRVRAVISDTEEAPPVSPSHGDAYLVPAGATGAWSGHQDDIAIFTRNGWRFEIPGIGKWLLVEDVDGFKRYTATGWLYGPGARSFDDASIPYSAALGWGDRFIVESQTINDPPTATVGLRYIVGPIPTGEWVGHSKSIAICEVAGAWTFYAPTNGFSAYDKSLNSAYTFNGAAWASSAGSIVAASRVKTAATLTPSQAGSTFYTFSTSTAPSTSKVRTVDAATLAHTAKKANAELEFSYRASLVWSSGLDVSIASNQPAVLAIFRGAETDAIAWTTVADINNSSPPYVNVTLTALSPDAAAHTYTAAIIFGTRLSGTLTIFAQSYRLRDFSIKELS